MFYFVVRPYLVISTNLKKRRRYLPTYSHALVKKGVWGGREGKKGSRVGNDRGGGVFQFCSMLFAAASGLFAVELSTSTTTHLFEVTRDGFESQNYSLCFGSSRRRSKRVFAPQKTMLERTK